MTNNFNISDYIPKGKANAISKERLIQITGLSERKVRQEVANARRKTCIINDQDGSGYYKPDNKEEVKRYIKQEENRAKSIFANLSGARNYLNQMENQMYFADVI